MGIVSDPGVELGRCGAHALGQILGAQGGGTGGGQRFLSAFYELVDAAGKGLGVYLNTAFTRFFLTRNRPVVAPS